MQPTGSAQRTGTGRGEIRIVGFGHAIFATTLIAVGIMGLVKGGFLAFWSGVPKDMPARTALAYLCALISMASGIGLLLRRAAAVASRVLLISFALWMLFFRVPLIFREPTSSGMWWAFGEIAVMIGAAWVLVVWFAGDREGMRPGFVTGDKGLRSARVLYGLGLIPFGIAHFTFLDRTVSMVPGWLPWHLGWAYFTGGALIAAGVAVACGVFARLAAMLSALEMSLFTLIVWIPIVAAGTGAFQWNEFVDSCVLSAAAWVVADSYRAVTVNTRSPRGSYV